MNMKIDEHAKKCYDCFCAAGKAIASAAQHIANNGDAYIIDQTTTFGVSNKTLRILAIHIINVKYDSCTVNACIFAINAIVNSFYASNERFQHVYYSAMDMFDRAIDTYFAHNTTALDAPFHHKHRELRVARYYRKIANTCSINAHAACENLIVARKIAADVREFGPYRRCRS